MYGNEKGSFVSSDSSGRKGRGIFMKILTVSDHVVPVLYCHFDAERFPGVGPSGKHLRRETNQ